MKDNQYYIERILLDMEFIMKHTQNIKCVSELTENALLLDAMSFRLIQIAENITKITDDFKIMHNMIPWQDIKGFRNRLVHDYGNVDLKFVYSALKEDVPELRNMFKELKESQSVCD